jgi:hypothetical protein
MNTSAIPFPDRISLLWIDRVRGLFAGTGFAVAISLGVMFVWVCQGIAREIPTVGLLRALQHVPTAIAWSARIVLPLSPLIAIMVNLAPFGRIRRAAWLGSAVLLMICWCVYIGHGFSFSLDWIRSVLKSGFYAEVLESALSAGLVVWAVAYYRSASHASDALLRTQIAGATLDTELQRAHLQLLRAQIEPHFLFNTLANLRTLARIDRASAVEMIGNLMCYFAAALPKIQQYDSALGEEMQLLDAYLSIYKVRMGTRLSYELDLPQSLAELRVPTMMLLTLVENALKHGINPAVQGGFIRVRATRERESLVLAVADSGHGMTVTEGHGTGLANVRLRLMMLYGDAAVLSLAHAEPRGVVATLRLPIPAIV